MGIIEPPRDRVYVMNLDTVMMSCGTCGREYTGNELFPDSCKVSLMSLVNKKP
jgi:hypothetical protein